MKNDPRDLENAHKTEAYPRGRHDIFPDTLHNAVKKFHHEICILASCLLSAWLEKYLRLSLY